MFGTSQPPPSLVLAGVLVFEIAFYVETVITCLMQESFVKWATREVISVIHTTVAQQTTTKTWVCLQKGLWPKTTLVQERKRCANQEPTLWYHIDTEVFQTIRFNANKYHELVTGLWPLTGRGVLLPFWPIPFILRRLRILLAWLKHNVMNWQAPVWCPLLILASEQ